MSYVALEYMCPEHGRFDSLELRATAPDDLPCPECGAKSEWVISAPIGRVKAGEVSQGKFEPPPSVEALDTRAIADGMSTSEWKAKRDQVRKNKLRAKLKQALS